METKLGQPDSVIAGPLVASADRAPEVPSPVSKSPLHRIGQLSPLWLAVAYTTATCVGMFLQFAAVQSGNTSLRALGAIISLAALLLLYIVVIWYRDDDTLSAGVLLAVTVLVGGMVASTVATSLVQRSFVAAVALMTFGWMSLIVPGFLLIPFSAVLVWFARFVSGTTEKVTAPGHRAHPTGSPRPYRSAWDRRQAKLNEKKTE